MPDSNNVALPDDNGVPIGSSETSTSDIQPETSEYAEKVTGIRRALADVLTHGATQSKVGVEEHLVSPPQVFLPGNEPESDVAVPTPVFEGVAPFTPDALDTVDLPKSSQIPPCPINLLQLRQDTQIAGHANIVRKEQSQAFWQQYYERVVTLIEYVQSLQS